MDIFEIKSDGVFFKLCIFVDFVSVIVFGSFGNFSHRFVPFYALFSFISVFLLRIFASLNISPLMIDFAFVVGFSLMIAFSNASLNFA